MRGHEAAHIDDDSQRAAEMQFLALVWGRISRVAVVNRNAWALLLGGADGSSPTAGQANAELQPLVLADDVVEDLGDF